MFQRASAIPAIAALIVIGTRPLPAARELHSPPLLPIVAINDNRHPAGTWNDDSLVLTLRAAVGLWRPEGEQGPALEIEAFGEASGPLQVPAPLLRVPEGARIVASVRNDLDRPLRVHGLCNRDGTPCVPVDVAPGTERQVTFAASRAGTYHYWATTMGLPLRFRAAGDTQLSGAFIVDPPGQASRADRVLVITDWTSLTREQLLDVAQADDPGVAFLAFEPRFTFLVNGLSWPSTERLTYRLGEDVRWRVVNLSSQDHPMHLHGFYFVVDSLGDGSRDTSFDAHSQRRVVTQLLEPGDTMAMTWRPEREGNWVFHCHVSEHIAPGRRLGAGSGAHAHHPSHDAAAGMAGLVLGVTILPGEHTPAGTATPPSLARRLILSMASDARSRTAQPAFGFALSEHGEAPAPPTVSAPGPVLVLERTRPVEITLMNRLAEPTAIHWHGMELESYYDGVHGWSGTGRRITPLIEPNGSFLVRFTPPRTGTFIYHTHMHDDRQLTGGLYGAMVVVEPGEAFDPAVDHVVVIGRDGPGRDAPVVLNGSRSPVFVWKAGVRHRIRFINITSDDILVTSLATAESPVEWRPLTKDGAPVPSIHGTPRPAHQTIAVGETYDFAYDAPAGRRGLWINVRTPGGKWAAQGRVVIK